MSYLKKLTEISKWAGLILLIVSPGLSNQASAYYLGPPSQVAVINLVDSVGPVAPAGITVVFNPATNQMEVTWATLQSSDDRNYGAYPTHNLHAVYPYLLEVRIDDNADAFGVPIWTSAYSGTNNFFNHSVLDGHKYVYRVAGQDEAPYQNTGDYVQSDNNSQNDVFTAPTAISDLDAYPTPSNSSAMLTWSVPSSKDTFVYNIYRKAGQTTPLLQSDIVSGNLLTSLAASSWTTQGGRSYMRWEHSVPTELFSGGTYVDIAYAVCAEDSEGHEADISFGDGQRCLNPGFEDGSLNWTIDPADATYISINVDPGNDSLERHSGQWSTQINTGLLAGNEWQNVDLKVSTNAQPKVYSGKLVTASAWVWPSARPTIGLYAYSSTGAETFLGNQYFESVTFSVWQKISYTATTLADTETVQARFYVNTGICTFDDIEIFVPTSENSTVTRVEDTTPPAAITTLEVYAAYSPADEVTLQWFNPDDNSGLNRFRVYRRASGQGTVTDANKDEPFVGGVGTEQFSVSVTELSPQSLVPGVQVAYQSSGWPAYIYYYAVAAIDDNDTIGLLSNCPDPPVMFGYPYDTTPPEPVTVFQADFIKSASPPTPPHSIHLEWMVTSDVDDRGTSQPIKYYNVYRSEQTTPITSLAGMTPLYQIAAAVMHEDQNVSPNTVYYYAITATDISAYPNSNGNEGTYYNSLGVDTDINAPQFLTSYSALVEDDYWCPATGNGTTSTVKNNSSFGNKYANGDTIDIEIDLGETGLATYILGDFTEVDNYGFNTVVNDNGDGTYQITHFIDPLNTRPTISPTCGNSGYFITIQVTDENSNGPTYDSTFDVELDVTSPQPP